MVRQTTLALVFVAAIAAAAGTIQADPILKGNFIVRGPDGRRVGYIVRDPLLRDGKNFIRFEKGKKTGIVIQDPVLPDRSLIFDSDSVGE